MNYNAYSAVIALIYSYFSSIAIPEDLKKFLENEDNLSSVYRAAEHHDITHIVGASLDNEKLLENGDIADKFHNSQMMAMFRYECIKYDQETLFQLLEDNGIEFIPLKGAVLRDYYPLPWLRTSCDVDILIHEQDLENTIKVMCEKGEYKTDEHIGSHDVSLFSKNGVHIELHFTLYESMDIDDVWKTAVCAAGKTYHKLMSKEMFYCHQVAHCAKHFASSGCGIRLFLDMWLLNSKENYDRAEIDRILSYGNYCTFEKATSALSRVWFSGEKHTPDTQEMQNYIFKSGIYGNLNNKVLINQAKKGGAFKYAMSRIFMPYTQLCYYYPILRKHKILLPFLEVVRWFRLVFGGKASKSVRELSVNANVSKEKQEKMTDLLARLELK